MDKQPEALRLADELDAQTYPTPYLICMAAEELRRLHKEVESFNSILDQAFKDQTDAERYMYLKWILTDPSVKKKFDDATPEDIDDLLDELIRSYDE